mmetsp:Transcript_236/g.502  ORF Transcript_236/g.502 Transcript_236/m.502 type:complete len:212 (-) Transcript_236:27-662(-)
MIIFSLVVGVCRVDRGHDGVLELGGNLHLDLFGDLLLFLGVVKDRRPILGTSIALLTIQRGRVVHAKEKSDQILVLDFVLVVLHVENFSVTGASRTHFLIGDSATSRLLATHVSHRGCDECILKLSPEELLRAPEAAGSKGCLSNTCCHRWCVEFAVVFAGGAFVFGGGVTVDEWKKRLGKKPQERSGDEKHRERPHPNKIPVDHDHTRTS